MGGGGDGEGGGGGCVLRDRVECTWVFVSAARPSCRKITETVGRGHSWRLCILKRSGNDMGFPLKRIVWMLVSR